MVVIGDMMTQFGLRFMNTSEWVISKRMFRSLNIEDRLLRPLEGDLLMVGPSGGLETATDPQFTYLPQSLPAPVITNSEPVSRNV